MALKANFTQGDVERFFNRFLNQVDKMQVDLLQELGEKCVAHAKAIPAEIGFTDQTGNLRSSIGYVVFRNGVAIHRSYEAVQSGGEGVRAGMELAEKVGAKYKSGLALVVTAGMDYALCLEARGRDVLTSAEMLAKWELPRMTAELKNSITKAMKQ